MCSLVGDIFTDSEVLLDLDIPFTSADSLYFGSNRPNDETVSDKD